MKLGMTQGYIFVGKFFPYHSFYRQNNVKYWKLLLLNWYIFKSIPTRTAFEPCQVYDCGVMIFAACKV